MRKRETISVGVEGKNFTGCSMKDIRDHVDMLKRSPNSFRTIFTEVIITNGEWTMVGKVGEDIILFYEKVLERMLNDERKMKLAVL